MLTYLINLITWFRNSWRWVWRQRVDYVRMPLRGTLPEFAPRTPWWSKRFLGVEAPLSLALLRQRLRRIAADPHTHGVIFMVEDLNLGWATSESLRAEMQTFRTSGKRIIVYMRSVDTRTYHALAAANYLLMPPTAYLYLLGVRVEAQFFGAALRAVGIEAEVVAITPYKAGADPFVRDDISPEHRQQLQSLLDQRYASLVSAIASDRGISEEQVRVLIDHAPYLATSAAQARLIDRACYEDELAEWITQTVGTPTDFPNQQKDAPILLDWDAANGALRLPYRRRQRRYIAVVGVEGTIVGGTSRNLPIPLPLLGGCQAGSDSIIQALRQVEQHKRVAALVLYVNSPGGDAFASDLIWREVLRLRKRMPVVVSMGDVAASGGYYVAACANAIVAQPGTLTGSIGVYSLRPYAGSLLERLHINTVVLSHGERSGLLSFGNAPNDADRAALLQIVREIYTDFKVRVCEGRNLSDAQLEPIAGGRVWTGNEAHSIGLVDLLGGLPIAVAKARELAALPPDPSAPLLYITADADDNLPPEPFTSNPAQLIALAQELAQPRMLALLPWVIDGV